jgi:hypothetical protein
MESVNRPRRLLGALAVLLPLAVAALGWPSTSRAASCPTMTFELTTGGTTLVPSQLTVAEHGCVTLSNQTPLPARFQISPHYTATVGGFSATGMTGEPPDYAATTAGRQSVTAGNSAGTARGVIVVTAPRGRPSPRPTQTPAGSSPPASASPRPTAPATAPPAASPASSSAATPAAPTPTPRATPSRTLSIAVGPPPSPPSGTGASPPAPGRTALEAPADRSLGLPAALAALAVAMVAVGFIRVLLAEAADPVDNRPRRTRSA